MNATSTRIIVILAIIAAGTSTAAQATEAPSKEQLQAMRQQHKALCLADNDCRASLEAKANARRMKAAEKLEAQMQALRDKAAGKN
jgi:hypothetical protein